MQQQNQLESRPEDHAARGGIVGAPDDGPLSGFWTDYYRELFAKSASWLDHSNPATQSQTFAVMLESAGPVAGRRCLDVGCGHGSFSLLLAAAGAEEVVGIDIIAEAIETLRARYPEIRWEIGSPEDDPFCQLLGQFDLIFAIEVLQYVSLDCSLRTLWDCLRPGGRLVASVPNRDCPIVQRTVARFGGRYCAPTAGQLRDCISGLPALECWGLRGMSFQEDQRLAPYALSSWTTQGQWTLPPNRLAVTIVKQQGVQRYAS